MAKVDPFLRWAGGKRWLANGLASVIKTRLNTEGTYFEPFLGSGAMFFAVQPSRAILSDLNEDLIVTFKEVAQRPQELTIKLSQMPATREEYNRVRSLHTSTQSDKALRFIYLNRNCYGGLYRENQLGVFNVPYGGGDRDHLSICKNSVIQHAASLLDNANIELSACDFEKSIERAGKGDVVYCDPTYREVTRKQFDRYGKIIFKWEDQERLARSVSHAYSRGAVVILSNVTCTEVRKLYPQAAVIEVKRRKGLGTSTADHSEYIEYVFVFDPSQEWSEWAGIGALKQPIKPVPSSIKQLTAARRTVESTKPLFNTLKTALKTMLHYS
jgi:DNA adenine methylase